MLCFFIFLLKDKVITGSSLVPSQFSFKKLCPWWVARLLLMVGGCPAYPLALYLFQQRVMQRHFWTKMSIYPLNRPWILYCFSSGYICMIDVTKVIWIFCNFKITIIVQLISSAVHQSMIPLGSKSQDYLVGYGCHFHIILRTYKNCLRTINATFSPRLSCPQCVLSRFPSFLYADFVSLKPQEPRNCRGSFVKI